MGYIGVNNEKHFGGAVPPCGTADFLVNNGVGLPVEFYGRLGIGSKVFLGKSKRVAVGVRFWALMVLTFSLGPVI